MSSLSNLHLLRPMWLLALVPMLLLIWLLWRCRGDVAWRRVIAPHLLPHLLAGNDDKDAWPGPMHLLGLFWLVGVIALAGPSWQREMAPFGDQRGALVIALYLRGRGRCCRGHPAIAPRTGDAQDPRPAGTASRCPHQALVAYAGSAHVVMPFTTDARLVGTVAGELFPATDASPRQ